MTGFSSKRKSSEIRWLGPYAPTDRHADEVTLDHLIELRKDNERLRSVIREILSQIDQGGSGGKVLSRDNCITRARDALKEKE